MNQVIKQCSEIKLSDELEKIRDIFLNLGYPDRIIEETIERVMLSISPAKVDDSEEERRSPIFLYISSVTISQPRLAQAIRRLLSVDPIKGCFQITNMQC